MSNKLSCTGQPSLLASSWLKVEPTKARSCPSSPFQRTGELQTAEDIHTKLITSAPEVRNIPASHSTVAITSQDFQLETIRSAQTGNDQKASASGNLPDTSRIRSYQIRLVRKGLPDFSFENEEQIRRLMQKRTGMFDLSDFIQCRRHGGIFQYYCAIDVQQRPVGLPCGGDRD